MLTDVWDRLRRLSDTETVIELRQVQTFVWQQFVCLMYNTGTDIYWTQAQKKNMSEWDYAVFPTIN